jgi:hypothetical protein
VPLLVGEMRHERRPAAVLAGRTATRVAHVAIRTIPLKRLTAALMSGTEAIVPSARLPNREVRALTGRGRLTFDAGQLGANQGTVNWTFIRNRFVRMFVLFLIHQRRFVTRLLRLRRRSCDNVFVLVDRRAWFVRLVQLVDNFLRRHGSHRRQNRRSLGLLSLARYARVLVFVVRVARRAARLLDVVTDHRDDDVIRQPTLTWTVIIQNVTRPKLALLHQELPMDPRWRGKESAKGAPILAELVFEWQ